VNKGVWWRVGGVPNAYKERRLQVQRQAGRSNKINKPLKACLRASKSSILTSDYSRSVLLLDNTLHFLHIIFIPISLVGAYGECINFLKNIYILYCLKKEKDHAN
jgi:hypothetical protein